MLSRLVLAVVPVQASLTVGRDAAPSVRAWHVLCIRQVGALEASPQPSEPAAVDKVLTGLEFDELAAVEKTEAVSIMSVFARVEPTHKSRLVELLQAQV